MKSLAVQRFRCRVPLPATRLVNSLGLCETETPPVFNGEQGQALQAVVDPLLIFNDYRKSAKLSLRNTKILHAQLLKSSHFPSEGLSLSSLIDCYCKCDATEHAVKLFDAIPEQSIVSFNIVISHCNRKSLFSESWNQFCKLHKLGLDPDEITYGSVLSACTALQIPLKGLQVYSLALRKGLCSNGYVRSGMIDLFMKNYLFSDGLKLFYDVPCENVVCWNAIIAGAVRNGNHRVALDLFRQMCGSGTLLPNSYTFSSVLTACTMLEDIETGKGVQGLIVKYGSQDVHAGSSLINFYAKCGDMEGAMKEFIQMPFHNVVSWTAMMSGFVQQDDYISAFQLFQEMRRLGEEINKFTVTSILNACGKPTLTDIAAQVHAWIIRSGFNLDAAVDAALMNMYFKVGDVDSSELLFRETENVRNANTWTVMLSVCAQADDGERAIELFRRMLQEGVRPNIYSASSLLSVVGTLRFGRQVHCDVMKSGLVCNVSVGSSLFAMYSRCGSLEESYKIFGQIEEKDNVSWASMIYNFSAHGCAGPAVQLFREMLLEGHIPDPATFNALTHVICSLNSEQNGKEVHGKLVRLGFGKEIMIGSALVIMYSRCALLELARRVFDLLPSRDDVAYSYLISGFAQNGYIEKAFLLFHEMLVANFSIDSFSVSSVIQSLTIMNRSDIGMQLHSYITKVGLDSNVSVGSSLVTMYSTFGSIDDCIRAFDRIEEPDLIHWTAIIMSYARHGRGEDALRFFELMKGRNIEPDPVTFLVVLSACSHSGLVEEGYFHFNSMVRDYGIEPNYRHYACMVDLLGRSGRLKEAEAFINNMPIEPNGLVWETLLAVSKVHGDIELGKLAARKLTKCKPSDAGAYISFANICANIGQWEEVMNIRSSMEGVGAKKPLGWSVI